jgi:hypothetical protein
MRGHDVHVFQGMRRDNHPIRQDAKFLWDAKNIRITSRDGNTSVSITSELGDTPIFQLDNLPLIGYCVLGDYLILFAGEGDSSVIYRVTYNESANTYNKEILYKGGTLNFSTNAPIETLGVYENQLVQKVYWIDKNNQPRVINVTKPELKGVEESSDYTSLYTGDNPFDFVATLKLNEGVSITKHNLGGTFEAGVIQYALTYYNKYGQESNIFYISPIQYIAPNNRGGKQNEQVSCSFSINIIDLDSFDYVRIYSIYRSSLDAEPVVKLVSDVAVEDTIYYTDNGTTGSVIDSTQLLYIGGEQIIAGTIAAKDGTLFLGNITQKRLSIPNNIFELGTDVLLKANHTTNHTYRAITVNSTQSSNTYTYNHQLNTTNLSYLKSGEHYRIGVQFQHESGKWSEPILLESDYTVPISSDNRPYIQDNNIYLPTINIEFGEASLNALKKLQGLYGYRKMRSVIVFPTNERKIIAQGLLCPTVFNVRMRNEGTLYGQSSWIFRPNFQSTPSLLNIGRSKGSWSEYRHYYCLPPNSDANAEIQNIYYKSSSENRLATNSLFSEGDYYAVDQNLVTLHSPDIEFDTEFYALNKEGYKLRILGYVPFYSVTSDINVQLSTPGYSPDSKVSATALTQVESEGGYHRNAILGFKDYRIREDDEGKAEVADSKTLYNYNIYMWQRTGSLNTDFNREEGDGTRTAVLDTKVMSHKLFSYNTIWLDTVYEYPITTPQYWGDDVGIVRWDSNSYLGDIDTMLSNDDYLIYSTKDGSIMTSDEVYSTNDAVRMKYKSSPHTVFKLKDATTNRVRTLPILEGTAVGKDVYVDTDNNGGTEESGGSNNDTEDSSVVLKTALFYAETSLNDITFDTSKTTPYLNSFGLQVGATKLSSSSCGMVINYSIKKLWWLRYGGSYTKSDDKTIVSWVLYNKSIDVGTFIKFTSSYDKDTYEVTTIKITGGSLANGFTFEYVNNVAHAASQSTITGISTTYNTEPASTLLKAAASSDSTVVSNVYDEIPFSKYTTMYPYLFLGELYNPNTHNSFGGSSKGDMINNNTWIPASEPVEMLSMKDGVQTSILPVTYGDFYYQRYDCLKTYPAASTDTNQLVEIASYMVETRINIDGRCDINRGLVSDLNSTPSNFNIINKVYSQKDNYFSYKMMDADYYKQHEFTNMVTWTSEKTNASETDPWTQITLINTLDLDGNKGKLTALTTYNDTLLALQEKAFSQILFNSRTQVAAGDGVPIEISNGYKVDGYRFLSDQVGCQNKWTVTSTPMGVYFIDKQSNSIYRYNSNGIADLSLEKGMQDWVRENYKSNEWLPASSDSNGIRTFYDNTYKDVYFALGPGANQETTLNFNETLDNFVSIFSYSGTYGLINFKNKFIGYKYGYPLITQLYSANTGTIFGFRYNRAFSFISNENPTITKIFDTVELRADLYDKDGNVTHKAPFASIEASNEYQKSDAGRDFKYKFRVWRANIPRNVNTFQRIRNPWAKISFNMPAGSTDRLVLHDLDVTYTY